MMAIASRMAGKAKMMSISRVRMLSTQPPSVAGDEPEHDAERAGDADRDGADLERDPCAVEEPAEDVAAELVGAEAGRSRSAAGDGRAMNCSVGPYGATVRADQRDEGEEADEHRAGHRQALLADAAARCSVRVADGARRLASASAPYRARPVAPTSGRRPSTRGPQPGIEHSVQDIDGRLTRTKIVAMTRVTPCTTG